MTASVRFGLPGVTISPGHHVCGLYSKDSERDRMMVPYFRAGLQDGDSCVVVVDDEDPSPVLAEMGTGSQVASWRASGRLDTRTAVPPRRGTAGLNVDEMLAQWDETMAEAQDPHGEGFIRLGGEASWWLPQATGGSIVGYEIELTRRIPERIGVLCLYDLTRFGGRTLVNAIATHPLVLVGAEIIENPYYTPPEQMAERLKRGETTEGHADEIRDRLHQVSRP
ncbi:MEDS domain-containing protein [Actinomadura barringtoniae]|uniref:MEDS domain-containing protein n=1 Tax=Actinomadura barringtoniae TaxID=1427535 RepID=A0A939P9X5_9ACTN|nr:MEDS domain-containing protein [Actinomadura barringtoniae]MBO2448620.1 MEDS domain-containing protein [Actinomadura barringtoniae]